MSEEMLTLDDLAKLKKQREEEKSKLPYKAYLDNLKILVDERNPKIYPAIKNLNHIIINMFVLRNL